MRYFLFSVALIIVCATEAQVLQKDGSRIFSAPTYYIVVWGQNWSRDGDLVKFRGASNLPPDANIMLTVSDFEGDAWKDYGGDVCVALGKEGFFDGEIHPKEGMRFRRNLILRANFQTNLCRQSASVLRIVGQKGEHLGERDDPLGELAGLSRNPQLYQISGWYYGLSTIARLE
jgi:hypothetical protein